MRLMLVVFCACAVGSAVLLPLGTTDTIGGTFHDCSVICNGIQRYVAYDPGYGVHAAWPCSQDTANRQVVDRSVRNPIVYRRIPADAIGVAEQRKPDAGYALLIWPTVTSGIVSLSGTDHAPVYDRSGRRRAVLTMGSNDLAALEPGVYFVNAAGRMLKLIIAR